MSRASKRLIIITYKYINSIFYQQIMTWLNTYNINNILFVNADFIIYNNISEDQDVIGILEDIAEYVINTTGFFHSGAEPTINAMRKAG